MMSCQARDPERTSRMTAPDRQPEIQAPALQQTLMFITFFEGEKKCHEVFSAMFSKGNILTIK